MVVVSIFVSMYIIGLVLGLIMVSTMWAEGNTWKRIIWILGCLTWFIVIGFAAIGKKK